MTSNRAQAIRADHDVGRKGLAALEAHLAARIDRFDRSSEPDRVAAESVTQIFQEIAAVDSRQRRAVAALQSLRIEAVDRRAVQPPEGDGFNSRDVNQLAQTEGPQRMNGIRPNRETCAALVKRRASFANPDGPPTPA